MKFSVTRVSGGPNMRFKVLRWHIVTYHLNHLKTEVIFKLLSENDDNLRVNNNHRLNMVDVLTISDLIIKTVIVLDKNVNRNLSSTYYHKKINNQKYAAFPRRALNSVYLES